MKYYVCKHCGNIVAKVKDTGVPVVCCGEKMAELVPNTTDAAQEKHVPVVKMENGKVNVEVGSAAHPMTPEHLIEWVSLETSRGCQMARLAAGDKPAAEFALADGEKPLAVYAMCNLHGLWKAEV